MVVVGLGLVVLAVGAARGGGWWVFPVRLNDGGVSGWVGVWLVLEAVVVEVDEWVVECWWVGWAGW